MVGWSLSFCCSYFGESLKVTFSFFLRISTILSGNSPPTPIPAPGLGKKKKKTKLFYLIGDVDHSFGLER